MKATHAIGKSIANGVMLGHMTTSAVLGATTGGAVNSDNRMLGALQGGLIGTAASALILGPLTGQDATFNAVKGVSKVGLNIGKTVSKGIGSTAIDVTKGLGKGLMKSFNHNPIAVIGAAVTGAAVGGMLGDMDPNSDKNASALKGAAFGLGTALIPGGAATVAGLGVAGIGAGMVGIGAVGEVGRSMIEKTAEGSYKLSATATPLLVGTMAVKGIAEGVKAFEKGRMGVNDGTLVGPTPTYQTQQSYAPSYANNAGATGDLVFSMFNNR